MENISDNVQNVNDVTKCYWLIDKLQELQELLFATKSVCLCLLWCSVKFIRRQASSPSPLSVLVGGRETWHVPGVGVRRTIIYDNVLDQPCVVSLEGTITPAYSLHIIIISLTPTPTPRRRYHCPQPDKKDPPRAEDQKKLMLGGVSYNLYIQLLGNISSRKVQWLRFRLIEYI